MTCKCPNCGAALTVMLAAAPIEVPKANVVVAKAPKFSSSATSRLRKCLHAVGLRHDATIFNDRGVVRQDGTQRRRLKVWFADYSKRDCARLAEQCAKEFGDDLISAGRVVTKSFPMRESVSFCVHLKVQ